MIKQFQRRRAISAGFMLLEMSLSLILFSAFMMVRMRNDFNDLLDLRAKNAAKVMLLVQGAVNDTLASYYDSFVNMPDGAGPAPLSIIIGNGASTVSIADGFHPTIANLVDLGKLPKNFVSRSPVGGNFKIFITKSPAGCLSPNCNLEAQVVIDSPFLINGKVDEKRMGLAVRSIGVDGAGTSREKQNILSGFNGQWSVPLPASITPAGGILAIRAGYSSSAWAPFFRIDGSRWMTADGNFGGHSLLNVKQVQSTLKAVDEPCLATENGAFGSGVVNGSGTVMVCSNGKWKVQDGLTANAGDACSPEGAMATSATTGEQLVCKLGTYKKLVNLLSKNVEISRLIVTDGQVVQKPVCEVGGQPDYTFNMNQTSVDVTVIPPKQSQYVSTVDNGGSWSVLLKLKADTGAESSGNVYSLSAIMHLECKY